MYLSSGELGLQIPTVPLLLLRPHLVCNCLTPAPPQRPSPSCPLSPWAGLSHCHTRELLVLSKPDGSIERLDPLKLRASPLHKFNAPDPLLGTLLPFPLSRRLPPGPGQGTEAFILRAVLRIPRVRRDHCLCLCTPLRPPEILPLEPCEWLRFFSCLLSPAVSLLPQFVAPQSLSTSLDNRTM